MHPIIEECFKLLARSTDDADEMSYEDQLDVQQELQTLARRIIAQLDNPKLQVTVQWWEGCHCHGDNHSESFESHSIEEMARQLAGCEHTVTDRGSDYCDRVTWVLDLSEQEQDQLKEQFNKHAEHNKEIKRLTEWREALKKALAKADAEIPTETRELDALRSDLTFEAILKREEAIAKKVSGRGKVAADLAETETKIVALSNQKP